MRRARTNKGASNKVVEDLITRRLRNARLTAIPVWYKSPGQYRDPPEIQNAPNYFLKQRVVSTVTPEQSASFTPSDLANAFANLFLHLVITRVDVWGPSGDGILEVTYWLPSETGVVQRAKTFYGTGVTGSKRPYVSAMIATKDASRYAVADRSDIVEIKLYDTKGADISGDIIADFYVTYYSSSFQFDNSATFKVISPAERFTVVDKRTALQGGLSHPT